MDFPQYRKKFDNQSFYKIISATEFQEIQLIGKRFFQHHIIAEKYFEQLRITEMLEITSPLYLMSTQQEFEEFHEAAAIYLENKQRN